MWVAFLRVYVFFCEFLTWTQFTKKEAQMYQNTAPEGRKVYRSVYLPRFKSQWGEMWDPLKIVQSLGVFKFQRLLKFLIHNANQEEF